MTTVAYIDHVGVLSGGEIALDNLIAALDRRRWEPIIVLGQDGPLRQRLEATDVPVTVIGLPRILSNIRQGDITFRAELHPGRVLTSLAYAGRLARYFRASNVQLIHANTLRACLLAGLAGRLAGIPSVWQIHSVVGSPLMAPRGLRLVQRLARIWPSHVICNSRQTAADFNLPAERISVIPCGVDSRRFSPNGRRSGNQRVGMVARFAPIKGQHVFVQAAGRLARRQPNAEFVVAGAPLFGESSYASHVRASASHLLNHEAIRFLGFVDDVPSLLHTLDIVVNPSTHPEGLGQVIIEAMMAGKPVVASAEGGPVDVIEDGVTGRLIPPGDPAALAEALDAMLRDPRQAAAMGQRGRERAVERYDIRATARAVQQVYSKVLSK